MEEKDQSLLRDDIGFVTAVPARIISSSDLSPSIHGDTKSWLELEEGNGDENADYSGEKSNSVDTIVKTNARLDVRKLHRLTTDLHEVHSTSNKSPGIQDGKEEEEEEENQSQVSSMMSYYEEIHFQSSNQTLDRRSLSHGYEDIAPVEIEASGSSRPSLRTPSQSQNFFPSGDEEQPYENIVLNQSGSRGSRDSPVGSHHNPNSPYYETMFGMARRFPSIRMTPSGKKSRKRKTSLAQSTTSSTEDFPRSAGNNISLDFETLDGLYSKPHRAGHHVDLRQNVDSAINVGDGSGSCVRPAHAIYDIVKVPSLASIRSYLSGKLSLNTKSNKVSSSTNLPNPNSAYAVQADLPKSHPDIKKDFDGRQKCCCPCFKSSQRRLNYQERSSESVERRNSCLSTPFLLIIIVISIIIFIIAGAILIHQHLLGHAIWASGNVARAPSNQSRETFRAQNQSEATQVARAPSLQSSLSSRAKTQGISLLDHWDHWSPWSPCSSHCRQSGESQARSRSCLDATGTIREDIKPCLAQGGLNIEIRRCLCNQSEAFQEALRSSSSVKGNPSAQAIRFCDHCTDNEACVALADDYFPVCRLVQDPGDPTGCGGLCSHKEQLCHRLDKDAFRCVNVRQSRHFQSLEEVNCLPGYFQCFNGQCIPWSQKCDGIGDCPTREDEIGCDNPFKRLARVLGSRQNVILLHTECPTSHLLCNDGETCLEPDLFCNGVVDCPDKSDEPGGCEAKDDHKGSGVISNPNYEFEK